MLISDKNVCGIVISAPVLWSIQRRKKKNERTMLLYKYRIIQPKHKSRNKLIKGITINHFRSQINYSSRSKLIPFYVNNTGRYILCCVYFHEINTKYYNISLSNKQQSNLFVFRRIIKKK